MTTSVLHASADLGSTGWRKDWSGSNGGQCVEVKELPDGSVAVRQSTAPDGPALLFTKGEMTAFLNGVKEGKADFLLS